MSFFVDPQMFFFSDCRLGQIRLSVKFEGFWYSRTFLGKFVRNRAKSVGVSNSTLTNFSKNVLEYRKRSKFDREPYLTYSTIWRKHLRVMKKRIPYFQAPNKFSYHQMKHRNLRWNYDCHNYKNQKIKSCKSPADDNCKRPRNLVDAKFGKTKNKFEIFMG